MSMNSAKAHIAVNAQINDYYLSYVFDFRLISRRQTAGGKKKQCLTITTQLHE